VTWSQTARRKGDQDAGEDEDEEVDEEQEAWEARLREQPQMVAEPGQWAPARCSAPAGGDAQAGASGVLGAPVELLEAPGAVTAAWEQPCAQWQQWHQWQQWQQQWLQWQQYVQCDAGDGHETGSHGAGRPVAGDFDAQPPLPQEGEEDGEEQEDCSSQGSDVPSDSELEPHAAALLERLAVSLPEEGSDDPSAAVLPGPDMSAPLTGHVPDFMVAAAGSHGVHPLCWSCWCQHYARWQQEYTAWQWAYWQWSSATCYPS
jgi:hypothetical protein